MIVGIGIDSVEINRFTDWHTWPHEKLLRIFSQEEIDYCLSCPTKSAERFAVRFAAKEAFLKGLHSANPENNLALTAICRNVSVTKQTNGAPVLVVDWEKLPNNQKKFIAHISLTHTKTTATSVVIFEIA